MHETAPVNRSRMADALVESPEAAGAAAVELRDEEWINTLTHGVGFLLSAAGALTIAWLALDRFGSGEMVVCLVYALTLMAVYCFSTLSHAVRHPELRERMRAWDQGAIYLLIAGTYTPFIWVYSSSSLCIALLTAVWGAAAVGFYTKVIARHRVNALAVISYVLLGWLPAIPLAPQVATACFLWMAAGGLLYSLGVILLKLDERYRYFHAGWHTCVILASACHFYAIVRFALLATAG